ncbi:hypothetical protein C8T65DRAFT_700886 [Cerioporus squamosus]|nr:hypothetical protein C8T65DRAFT_700886 [Cerioporus squamosus]
MPAVNSYLRRVQQALHELVIDFQLDISLDLLMLRILGPADGLNGRYRSRSESRVSAVLKREVRARRITIDRGQTPMLVSVTSDGKTFYRAFGSEPLYEAGDARLMRLTIPQLDRLAAECKRVLEDVQQTFLDHYPHNTDAQDLTTLPNAIRDFYETLTNLEHSHSDPLGEAHEFKTICIG